MKKVTQGTVPQKKSAAQLQKELQETQKNLKSSIILAVTTLIAVMSVCLAWYVNNSKVDTAGVQIKNAEGGFELASAGTDTDLGYYDGLLTNTDLGYKSKWNIGSVLEKLVDTLSGTITEQENQNIIWCMTADSNLHNTDEYIIEDNEVGSGLAEEERRPGISPGSSGELTFYVIPKQKDELTVQFTLELEAYSEVDQNTKDADAIEVTLTTDTTLGEDNQIWIKQVDEENAALQLLEGHLMFFETRTGSEESGYYYSDQLFDWSFERTLTAEELEAGEPVEITIYWAWPYVLGQAMLPTSAYQLNGTTLFDTTSEDANAPRKLLYNQMIKNPKFYFYDATDTGLTGLSVATLSKIYEANYTQEEYSKISRYYNAADQYIGDNIRYIFVRLSAQS